MTERYTSQPVRNRFTAEMLRDYLHHLGIDAFNADFYEPARSILVSLRGLPMTRIREFTLEEIRKLD